MALIENDFGCDVFWGSADCECPAFGEEFSKSEVSKLKISVIADEQIFWFKISEDDVFGVQIFEAGSNDGGIEACLVSSEGLYVPEVGKEFSSVDQFQNEI